MASVGNQGPAQVYNSLMLILVILELFVLSEGIRTISNPKYLSSVLAQYININSLFPDFHFWSLEAIAYSGYRYYLRYRHHLPVCQCKHFSDFIFLAPRVPFQLDERVLAAIRVVFVAIESAQMVQFLPALQTRSSSRNHAQEIK